MPFYSFWRCVIQSCLVAKWKKRKTKEDITLLPLHIFQRVQTRVGRRHIAWHYTGSHPLPWSPGALALPTLGPIIPMPSVNPQQGSPGQLGATYSFLSLCSWMSRKYSQGQNTGPVARLLQLRSKRSGMNELFQQLQHLQADTMPTYTQGRPRPGRQGASTPPTRWVSRRTAFSSFQVQAIWLKVESFATFKEPRDNGIFTIIQIPIISSIRPIGETCQLAQEAQGFTITSQAGLCRGWRQSMVEHFSSCTTEHFRDHLHVWGYNKVRGWALWNSMPSYPPKDSINWPQLRQCPRDLPAQRLGLWVNP